MTISRKTFKKKEHSEWSELMVSYVVFTILILVAAI